MGFKVCRFQRYQFRAFQRAFTLVELMIVVTIIALVTSVAIPTFIDQKFRAQESEAPLNIGKLVEAQIAYHQKPRVDASGDVVFPIMLTVASKIDYPDRPPKPFEQRIAKWATDHGADYTQGWNFLYFRPSGKTYFSYSAQCMNVGGNGQGEIRACDSPDLAGCSEILYTPCGPPHTPANAFVVGAVSDLDGDGVFGVLATQGFWMSPIFADSNGVPYRTGVFKVNSGY